MNPFELSDKSLEIIEQHFAVKKELAAERRDSLFSVFSSVQNEEERIALKFLYAFMPLVDLADYNGELFLSHVRHSLRVRQTVSWGSKVPGDLFLHFVLPYRISNETIEDYRGYFYNELFERVEALSMTDAILEINHWCHEKATYIASDPRTASPLTLIRTAQGRCGEESALLVLALRSLGIPARQVYTPRWAHTDSNHAWVEAWADGEWFFLGACEPEPKLNMGWFEGPSRRAMLIHTRVPGHIYAGPEEKVQVRDDYTEINLLQNYAPTRQIVITVKNNEGRPVEGARVDLKVFNYGQFSTIVRLISDENGKVSITTGRGDVMIFASTPTGWGFVFVEADGPENVEVIINDEQMMDSFELRMTPPPELTHSGPTVTAAERAENDKRLKYEDEIRAAYESTFISPEQARKLAEELRLNGDGVCDVISKARGNSHEIAAFLKEAVPVYGELALQLLQAVSEKDLTDTTKSVLLDHLEGSLSFKDTYDEELFIRYILQPRVSLEVLRPYRSFFQKAFSAEKQQEFREQPALLVAWIEENITEVSEGVVRGWPTPQGVFELKAGDTSAKQILFVAAARSFGIPARLSPVDGKAQYFAEQNWIDAGLEQEGKVYTKPVKMGTVRLHKSADYSGKVQYYQNFTLARMEENKLQTLRFRGLDEEKFDEENFSQPLEVRPGYYWLTTGNRLADGTVLVTVTPFQVQAGQTTDIELVFLEEEVDQMEWGEIPTGLELKSFTGDIKQLDQFMTKQGLVLAWIEPDREPTKHLIRDLTERRSQFENQDIEIVLCVGEDKLTDSFSLEQYKGLPRRTTFLMDRSYHALERVEANLKREAPRNYPVVFVADGDRKIRYLSTGYQIGTGAHILQHLRKDGN